MHRKLVRCDGIEIDIGDCLGCALFGNPNLPFGGIVYETENFFVTQDFELPIEGFLIISFKEHKRFFTDLSREQKNRTLRYYYQT